MKIHELKIEGFKSIGSITLTEPNPFSVFVGPNAAGKSNIFEALEFMQLCNEISPAIAARLFGGFDNISNQTISNKRKIFFEINLGTQVNPSLTYMDIGEGARQSSSNYSARNEYDILGSQISKKYTRLFVNNKSIVKQNVQDDLSLASDASNLEKILKRILKEDKNREEFIEILQLLIPGLSHIEIITEELSNSDSLIIYENALKTPLSKHLISDGTYNIIALIAAVYQSEEPQFLCIEEPENGLNPKVVRELVQLFRDKCKEKGHYIWLNTHSQTLVSELTTDEIILVDKVNGQTQVKQVKGKDLHGLKMDEALLTNALGGGIPW